MPGYEIVGKEEQQSLNEIFETSNGVLFPHAFVALRNNRYRVREFERAFSGKFGCKYSQAVTSGTVAQLAAMLAMGIRPGDEVITQAFTFVATVEAILAIGAVPVIVDIDDTYNMSPAELENAITDKTKLIVPVHMLGNPAEMDDILRIARKHHVPVLEDACEALGATYRGKYAGTIADAGVFSLDFQKTITTGEGGMIVTDDERLFTYAKEYHDHGHENKPSLPRGRDTRTIPGMNYRMNEMQGAVGLAQLQKLDFIVASNRKNKKLLKEQISVNEIAFRRITDQEGDLADTLIFSFESSAQTNKFVEKYQEAGYSTKNIPDAIDWHFAGTWNHMFHDVPAYRDTWKSRWKKSAELLARSVALPIYVKPTETEMIAHAEAINRIMKGL